jgi:hypothetical protein
MAVTFSPLSVSFGDVVQNQQDARQITFTNPDSAPTDVTVVAPTGAFALIPAGATLTVPGATTAGNSTTPGEATLIVTFTPSAAQLYSGQVVLNGVPCSLAGTGVSAQGVDIYDGSKKSLLIKVPDYAGGLFEQSRATDAEQSLSSFLRLGNFDYSAEPPRAKELLKVMHQAGPPGDPARGDHLQTGSGTSAVDAWAWDADSSDFPAVPPLQARDSAGKPASAAGNKDVFFVDDVRKRDVDVFPLLLTGGEPADTIQGNGLTMAQRQAESARLYSRGGWRDHSDGNRITTTYGDKVEVIRGNYKMIVMGRQDDPANAQGWEVSGSHIQDYAPGTMPGASYWLEWVPDYRAVEVDTTTTPPTNHTTQTGVWLLANTTENVYQFSRNAGHFRTETWGDLAETYVGSENPPPLGQVTGAFATDAVHGSAGHVPPATLPGVHYDLPSVTTTGTTTAGRAAPAWANDNQGRIRSNPHVVNKTWARRIDDWTGSPAYYVPDIYEKTYAGHTHSETRVSGTTESYDYATTDYSEKHVSGTSTEKTFASTLNSYTGSSDDKVGTMVEETHAGTMKAETWADMQTEWNFLGVQSAMTLAGLISELTLTGMHTEAHVSLIHTEAELALLHTEFEASLLHLQFSMGIDWEIKALHKNVVMGPDTGVTPWFKRLALKADIGIAPPDEPPPPNLAQMVTDAQNAQQAAEAAQAAAEAAQTGAETAQTGAEAAQAGAEAAQTGAEAAQTGAEAAQTGAQAAQTGAEAAQTGAQAAQTGAEAAQTGAQAAQTGAEAAQTGAQAAQTGAEAAQTGAQAAQTGAEAAQTGAQAAQTGAEAAQTGAQGSAAAAQGSAAAAQGSAAAAQGSATAAEGSAAAAQGSAAEAAAAAGSIPKV